jgi:hypothetical protein
VSNPAVGRIVHYVLPETRPYGLEHRAAIITQVWQPLSHASAPGMSNLTVFKGQSIDFPTREGDPIQATAMIGSVLYSEEPKPGTWHWPEREDA